MKYELPKLPYAYDALEPYIDRETLHVHHTGHHKAYVDKLNAALEKFPELNNVPLSELLAAPDNIPVDIREDIRNNGGGHFTHSMFWQLLTPEKQKCEGNLAQAIEGQFGGFENFKSKFSDTALKQFGSGYAWLCLGPDSRLKVFSLPNQDTPMKAGCEPILLIDVWEHAYYLKYQNKRAQFIEAFWNIVDWRMAETYFMAALVKRHKQIPAEAGH